MHFKQTVLWSRATCSLGRAQTSSQWEQRAREQSAERTGAARAKNINTWYNMGHLKDSHHSCMSAYYQATTVGRCLNDRL